MDKIDPGEYKRHCNNLIRRYVRDWNSTGSETDKDGALRALADFREEANSETLQLFVPIKAYVEAKKILAWVSINLPNDKYMEFKAMAPTLLEDAHQIFDQLDNVQNPDVVERLRVRFFEIMSRLGLKVV